MTNIFIYNTLPKSLFHCPLNFLHAGAVFKEVQLYLSAKILKCRVKERSYQLPSCCMRLCTPPHQSAPQALYGNCKILRSEILPFLEVQGEYQNHLRKCEVTSASCFNSGHFSIAVQNVTVTFNNVT